MGRIGGPGSVTMTTGFGGGVGLAQAASNNVPVNMASPNALFHPRPFGARSVGPRSVGEIISNVIDATRQLSLSLKPSFQTKAHYMNNGCTVLEHSTVKRRIGDVKGQFG